MRIARIEAGRPALHRGRTIATVALLLTGCGNAGRADWCAPRSDVEEVAFNSGPGLWRQEGDSARLVELWRTSSDEGTAPEQPVGISVGPDGRAAVTDFGRRQVFVVSPTGEPEGAWIPSGKSSGEVEVPVATNWSRDGTLAVFDAFGSKVLFARAGEPTGKTVAVDSAFLAPIVAQGGIGWAGLAPDGTVYIVPLVTSDVKEDMSRQTVRLFRLRPGRSIPDTLVDQEIRTLGPGLTTGVPAPGWPEPRAAVAMDGTFAVGGLDSHYRILLFNDAGRPLRQVCREVKPEPLRPDELGEAEGTSSRMRRVLERAEKPRVPSALGRIFIGNSGRLWIQRDRPDPVRDESFGRPGSTYDVFSSGGEYLGEIKAPEDVTLYAADRDRVWGVIAESGRYAVVAYRIERA